VAPGIGVLDGIRVFQGEREVLGVFLIHSFKWIFVERWQKRNMFDLCVKSFQYFRTNNMSTQSFLNAVFKNVLCYNIEVGIYKKFAKI